MCSPSPPQNNSLGSSNNSSRWKETYFKLHEDKHFDPYWSFPKTDRIVNTPSERTISHFKDDYRHSVSLYEGDRDNFLSSKNDRFAFENFKSADTVSQDTRNVESNIHHDTYSSDTQPRLRFQSYNIQKELPSYSSENSYPSKTQEEAKFQSYNTKKKVPSNSHGSEEELPKGNHSAEWRDTNETFIGR